MADLPACCRIVRDDYRTNGPADMVPMHPDALVDNMTALITMDNACCIVAEHDGHVLGVAAFTVFGDPWNPDIKNAIESVWCVAASAIGTLSGNKAMVLMSDAMIELAQGMGAHVFTLGGQARHPAVAKMLERRHGLKAREVLCARRIG